MSTSPQVSRRRALGYAAGTGVTLAAGAAGYLVAANSPAADPGPASDEYGPPKGGQPSGGAGGTALAALDAIPDRARAAVETMFLSSRLRSAGRRSHACRSR